jgi:beta-lactamase class A
MSSSILTALVLCALVAPACSASDPAPATAAPPSSFSTSAEPSPTSPPSTIDVATRATKLQAAVDAFVAEEPVAFSVVVLDLSTGARAAHLADRRLPSASLYKLFVARELLRRIDAGELTREQPAGDGQGRTVGQCVHAMIVVSDNACGSAGLRIVGRGRLDARLHADGFVSTSLASPQQTSAEDVARFLTLTRDDPAQVELYGLLRAQEVNDRLPQGLPPGTPLAHKTGDIRHYAHDAGVLTTPGGDVVVAILSGPWPLPCCDADHPGESERVAFGAIARLGRAVYDAIA